MRRPGWLSGRLGDPDATHALRAQPQRGARAGSLTKPLTGALALALLLAAIVALVALRRTPPAASAVAALPMADEAALLAAPTKKLSLWRFSADPRIVVAIFPSLHAQALALNRVAAFVERPGVPRDHVLDDTALAAAMGHTALTFDTYYYGHDYRSADLARFYATADHDRAALNENERGLRARLDAARFFNGAPAALITLPPHGDGILDPVGRTTVLNHELAHGAYFTDPAYAAYVDAFWTGLTEAQRSAFRQFLEGEGYDGGNDDLMRNETQAYLIFTADPRMFDPTRIGVPEALELRRAFIAGLPTAWLRKDADPP
jgi:hypothetical protein